MCTCAAMFTLDSSEITITTVDLDVSEAVLTTKLAQSETMCPTDTQHPEP